ncbi:MAG TPA: HlyD family secretion protein, partial [Thiolinea sp.]|nr:HlyD family secretion protein [Thiolinea sp.]
AQSGETHATEAKAQLQVAQLELERAELDLSHTSITAPTSGILGAVRIRPGDYINTGQNLFPMVDNSSIWVAANFKETDLEHIRPGQPVDIVLDMYPKLHYQGQVESVSPASGTAFSLIPAQNATGNWVKVTQRFPVHIRIRGHEGLPLPKVGASAAVTIDASAATDGNGRVTSGPEKVAEQP